MWNKEYGEKGIHCIWQENTHMTPELAGNSGQTQSREDFASDPAGIGKWTPQLYERILRDPLTFS